MFVGDKWPFVPWNRSAPADPTKVFRAPMSTLLAAATLLALGCPLRADPILDAAAFGETAKLKELQDKDPALVNKRDKAGARKYSTEGSTALHYAAEGGYLVAVKLLLDRKADARAANALQNTPLHEVCVTVGGTVEDAKNRRAVAELLLAVRADINAKNKEGVTPLHLAAYHGNKDMVELLLSHKADVKAVDRKGRTPLHWAIRPRSLAEEVQNPSAVVKLLIAHKAKVNARDRAGQTPLSEAQKARLTDLIKMLRAHGATHK